MRLVVTGGSGFIGTNFIRHIVSKYPEYKIVNIDKLTYSGNKANLDYLGSEPNYIFYNADIADKDSVSDIISKGDVIVNFAAESHVDNSINNPDIFIRTNILGTHNLLEVARVKSASLFLQVSTDEVYGSLEFDSPSSTELDILHPSSPYSASKASAEMICMANSITYNQPIIITRSSNNFGPFQFPEKVIPLFVTNLLEGKKIPLYGDGKNIRDWIHVEDNCIALDLILHKGDVGQIYNIGGGNELSNKELTEKILQYTDKDSSYITFVEDRLGHDLRYSLDVSKLRELGWSPKYNFDDGLIDTIEWYATNERWWKNIKKL